MRLAVVYSPAGPERLLREIPGCKIASGLVCFFPGQSAGPSTSHFPRIESSGTPNVNSSSVTRKSAGTSAG